MRVDSREAFGKMLEFVREFMPDLDDRVHYYSGGLPIFDLYGAEDEMQRALKKKVFLKSGGTLVIEQTEAMTTIDINSGRYLGSHDSEETAYRINLEAARMAARQLRLRNLGGIIIIDFIDMAEQEHRYQVQRALEQELARDHVKTTVYPISELGLMEMTRKRTTESLGRQLCEPCPACSGHGTVKTTETVSHEIFREIVRAVHKSREGKLLVMASTDVISRILDDKSTEVAELEASLSKTICFKAAEYYARDQFDVALL